MTRADADGGRTGRQVSEAMAMHMPTTAISLFAPPAARFSLPKAGNSAEEYEDAWATSGPADAAQGLFACAVADGATETSFSGLWARLLCEAYCAEADTPGALLDLLPRVQAAWWGEVGAIPLPWYAEEKARRGAFAAFVGLTIGAPGDAGGATGGRWTALACGDSCLFQVRDDALLGACPLARAEDFNNRPTLLSSDQAANAGIGDTLVYVGGDWLPGDTFYLLTDALACWFLAAHEAGDRPWRVLAAFAAPGDSADFAAWIAGRRGARELRNDDVTMLAVRL